MEGSETLRCGITGYASVFIVVGSCCSYCYSLGYDWCDCLEPYGSWCYCL